ncbi:DUF3305 domain-containing protein [Alkalilimnicola ehrlichii]|uniref:DUF3305 domain-containing protein n=1 Tax=Alkalilimnicola ehrlichii TaxID=351052 RepID=UPI003BA05AF0
MNQNAESAATLDGRRELPVAVVMAEVIRGETWGGWPVGVVAGGRFAAAEPSRTLMREGPDGRQWLWQGFRLRLRPQDAGDYALNLGSDRPTVFVVCKRVADGELRPLSTTVSLAEAQDLDAPELRDHSEQVYRVAMPGEVYHWVEHFVLDHYQPRRRKGKRRRRNAEYDDVEQRADRAPR